MGNGPTLSENNIFESLSKEQRKIVEAEPDDNVLVVAPPGTGKTHTVIARIKYLIEEKHLEPQELLVLCFTRAAVGEIMQRIRSLISASQVHDDLRFVSVRTFDSYATRLLLSDVEHQPDLSRAGYDDRIQMAVDILRDGDYESSAAHIVGACRHLIVDELQDVVGVRAELVKEILRLEAGGFTLLGDPAQAIYGFARPEEEARSDGVDSAADPGDLISWISEQKWPGGLERIELTHNYRSRGQVEKIGRTARQIVLSPMDDEAIYRDLAEILNVAEPAGSVRSPDPALSEPQYDSICILCRTNGELLQIASLLARHDIRHYIRPRSTEYALPPWIGRVLGPSERRRLAYAEFEDLWKKQIGDQGDVSPEQAFRWLKRVEGQDNPTLNISELHLRLYRGHRLPDDADASLTGDQEPLSLSTIHSAKGREFDQVVVLTPDSKGTGASSGEQWREEARVLYVAATRAREVLSRLERQGLYGSMWVETLSSGRRRWVSRRFNNYYMEVGLPDDVRATSPVSTYIHQYPGDALRLQNMLWSRVYPGTQLYIHRERRKYHTFFYIRPHQDSGLEQTDFAQLSLSFQQDLRELIKKLKNAERVTFPGYWTQARVTRVVTEVLPPYPEDVLKPFSRTGFCLGIRVRGLIPIYFGGNS